MKELRTSFLWKGDNGDEGTTYLVLVKGTTEMKELRTLFL